MIDNSTHTAGRGGAQFAEGGYNTTTGADISTGGAAPQGSPANPGTPQAPAIPPELYAMLAKLDQSVNTLNALLASGITAVIPDRTVTDINKRFRIIDDASGGFFS